MKKFAILKPLLLSLARLKLQTRFDVAPEADNRHPLRPGEHEAFYFLFASEDGLVSGGVRTLYSAQDRLEIVGLRLGESGWILQRRTPLPEAEAGLRLHCEQPWQAWNASLTEPLRNVRTGAWEPLRLELHFSATTPPALFRLGAYTQVQQDGLIEMRLTTAAGSWQGRLVSYRDHSWGQRGAGQLPGWMIVDIPQHLYAFILGTVEEHPLAVGRIVTPAGQLKPLRRPRIERQEQGWRISDVSAGFPAWYFERFGPAGVSYLGPPGEEFVDNMPAFDKALYQDTIGPARFVSPAGITVLGFWDEAIRLPGR